jgi:hypothetical protein
MLCGAALAPQLRRSSREACCQASPMSRADRSTCCSRLSRGTLIGCWRVDWKGVGRSQNSPTGPRRWGTVIDDLGVRPGDRLALLSKNRADLLGLLGGSGGARLRLPSQMSMQRLASSSRSTSRGLCWVRATDRSRSIACRAGTARAWLIARRCRARRASRRNSPSAYQLTTAAPQGISA